MALMLKEDVGYGIAIRHFGNKLIHYMAKIDDEAAKLNYKYLSQMMSPFNENLIRIHAGIVALDDLVGERDSFYIERELIKFDAQIKDTCVELLYKITQKKEELKIYASKFDDLLLVVMNLAKRNINTFIDQSIAKKEEIVQSLLDGTPTYANISQVLRLADLQNGAMLEVSKKYVRKYARAAAAMSADGADSLLVYDRIRDRASEETYNLAVEQVKSVLIMNEDGKAFVTGNLRKTNEHFWDKNNSKFIELAQEYIKEV